LFGIFVNCAKGVEFLVAAIAVFEHLPDEARGALVQAGMGRLEEPDDNNPVAPIWLTRTRF
jgi:hypothetical protein